MGCGVRFFFASKYFLVFSDSLVLVDKNETPENQNNAPIPIPNPAAQTQTKTGPKKSARGANAASASASGLAASLGPRASGFGVQPDPRSPSALKIYYGLRHMPLVAMMAAFNF
jgi:hypothetical protein